VRVRRAEENGVKAALRGDVVGEGPGACDQPAVLAPLDAPAKRRIHRH